MICLVSILSLSHPTSLFPSRPLLTLPDSPSSKFSSSRPTTPSLDIPTSLAQPQAQRDGPLALAAKAERILGLIPGTLVHARAALENARDEVRRTGDTTAPFAAYVAPPSSQDHTSGLKAKVNRARKAMSVSLSAMPNVVVGIGGKEEAEIRERRRRAVDGVLFWQKEVARLEAIEKPQRQSKR